MPSYTQADLSKVKEEIALERPHVCTGCFGTWPLSHSHLVKASRDSALYVVKENITYHCLGSFEKQGCHDKFEGMQAPTLLDFEVNFRIMHKLDKTYFWLRIFKLQEYWTGRDPKIYIRVENLIKEISNGESTVDRNTSRSNDGSAKPVNSMV